MTAYHMIYLLTSELKAYGLDIGRLNFLQVSR